MFWWEDQSILKISGNFGRNLQQRKPAYIIWLNVGGQMDLSAPNVFIRAGGLIQRDLFMNARIVVAKHLQWQAQSCTVRTFQFKNGFGQPI